MNTAIAFFSVDTKLVKSTVHTVLLNILGLFSLKDSSISIICRMLDFFLALK